MNKINIEIGDKNYIVEVAKSLEDKIKGLQRRKELKDNEGMLFDYSDDIGEKSFWMKDVLIPLDIIFINEDLEVITVFKGKPNSENLLTCKNVAYVLEVNVNSGIKVNDDLELEDNEEDSPVMKVLFQDGTSQYELWGGERIFRRAFTKLIIAWAKKAKNANSEEEKIKIYKRLGKKMFREIKAQDEREPEYVTNNK